jgi:FkbH-like protein
LQLPELKSSWLQLEQRNSTEERVAAVIRALVSGPAELDPPAVRTIFDLAEEIHSREPGLTLSLLKELQHDAPPACQWMKAGLLELQGNPEGAAVLDSFTHLHSAESEALRLQALCRNLIASQRWPEAVVALKESTQRTDSLRLLLANEKLLDRIRRAGQTSAKRQSKVAILGNATFDFLASVIRVCAFASGIDVEMYLGSYGQHQQEILGPSSALEAFRPSIVLLAVDWRSLSLPEVVPDPDGWVEASLQELRGLWRQCRERFHALVIQHNFEVPVASAYGRLSMATPGGRARLIQRLNLELWSAATTEPGVQILDVNQIASAYGKYRWDDRSLWHAAKQYPAAKALPVLARHQVALMRASLGLSSKCLVLDLDGTLWGGVIGEDGIAGIRLGGSSEGDAYREFQSYVKSLRERGVILTVCSKNNEADAKLVFTSHPETVLSLDDFALFLVDWRPKDENLRRIAQSLNIGLDSLVLVDDSPVERAWIRRQLPEVEVPEMPADPADYVKALDQHLYFEAVEVTEDDRQRAYHYEANLEREQFQAASANLEDFLAGLQMRVELRPFDEVNLPRIVQLINKTNQFNLTTQRLSENHVRGLIGSPDHYTQFMRVRDRFGDNGIVGILIASRDAESLCVDTWLMSCRVLGRRLEEVMLSSARKYAYATGYKVVAGLYRPTAKNHQVADLYDRLGFDLIETADSGERRYRLPLVRVPEYPSGFVVEDYTQVVAPGAEEIAPETTSQEQSCRAMGS